MRQQFDDVLKVRVPSALSARLRTAAYTYARSPSDVVREALVLQLDRLACLSASTPAVAASEPI